MGEECESNSRYSSTDGYQCIAGPQTVVLEGDVASEGAAARAHGYDSQAYGNFSFSYGALLRAHNGAQLIGKGNYSTGTPLTLRKPGLGLGFHVAKPTIFVHKAMVLMQMELRLDLILKRQLTGMILDSVSQMLWH